MNRSNATLLVLVALAVGYLAHWALAPPASTAEHWKAVNAHRAKRLDPAGREFDSSLGMFFVDVPVQYEPRLAALVAAGELEHIDLVLPRVPNGPEVNRYWMQFVQTRDDIVEAYGNPEYAAYKPAGPQPLHLQLWFKPSAADDVQQLIQDLEGLATEEQ